MKKLLFWMKKNNPRPSSKPSVRFCNKKRWFALGGRAFSDLGFRDILHISSRGPITRPAPPLAFCTTSCCLFSAVSRGERAAFALFSIANSVVFHCAHILALVFNLFIELYAPSSGSKTRSAAAACSCFNRPPFLQHSIGPCNI